MKSSLALPIFVSLVALPFATFVTRIASNRYSVEALVCVLQLPCLLTDMPSPTCVEPVHLRLALGTFN